VIDGVICTRVGYTGGTKSKPTYHNLGDHTESIQLDYDPQKISYGRLLEEFWENGGTCTREAWGRQYMSAVFYSGEAQREEALRSKERAEAKFGVSIKTQILPLGAFTLAEDYHQKYYLRKHRKVMELLGFLGSGLTLREFVDSHVATRLNGFLAGQGDPNALLLEMRSLGLSEEVFDSLRSVRNVKCSPF